jgi:hypothetical protein
MRFAAPDQAILAENCGRAKLTPFCPWQAGEDSLHNFSQACWPLLARLCSHSENLLR